MAIYVIDMKSAPPVVVCVTTDAKEAARIARVYADQNVAEVHLLDAAPNVVVGAAPVVQPITDPEMARVMNVLPQEPLPQERAKPEKRRES